MIRRTFYIFGRKICGVCNLSVLFSEIHKQYKLIYPDHTVSEGFKKYLILAGMPYLGQLRYDEMASHL